MLCCPFYAIGHMAYHLCFKNELRLVRTDCDANLHVDHQPARNSTSSVIPTAEITSVCVQIDQQNRTYTNQSTDLPPSYDSIWT